jgi:hypothetical protein
MADRTSERTPATRESREACGGGKGATVKGSEGRGKGLRLLIADSSGRAGGAMLLSSRESRAGEKKRAAKGKR